MQSAHTFRAAQPDFDAMLDRLDEVEGELAEVNSSLTGLRSSLHNAASEKSKAVQQLEKDEKSARKQGELRAPLQLTSCFTFLAAVCLLADFVASGLCFFLGFGAYVRLTNMVVAVVVAIGINSSFYHCLFKAKHRRGGQVNI